MKFRSPKTPQAPQQSFAFVAARAEALQRASPELRSIIVGEMCLAEGKVATWCNDGQIGQGRATQRLPGWMV
jgi:hypothetical protein